MRTTIAVVFIFFSSICGVVITASLMFPVSVETPKWFVAAIVSFVSALVILAGRKEV